MLAGLRVPAGTYTLWTVPRLKRADLVVNTQTGSGAPSMTARATWHGAHDDGFARHACREFTIAIAGSTRHGTS
jgi:hypothetical protein